MTIRDDTYDVSDRLLELSRRLDAKLRVLQEHYGASRRDSEIFQVRSGVARARGAPVRAAPRDGDDARRRRQSDLNEKIVAAVRRGDMWKAMKYELVRDMDILRYEIEHDLDLLISGVAETEERAAATVRRDRPETHRDVGWTGLSRLFPGLSRS